MHRWLLLAQRTASAAGFDPIKTLRFLSGLPRYIRHWRRFARAAATDADRLPMTAPFPCIGDAYAEGGTAKGHYFHQDLFVAQRIFSAKPRRHLDIGSRIDGFVAHVASFREIEVCDVRKTEVRVQNIRFRQLDLAGTLPPDLVRCCDSLSCLHAIEHIGLGRYGDAIDPQGHLKALENLAQILEPAGRLYLSTPIGPQRIEFNAHRVFSVQYILNKAAPDFELLSLSFVDDRGDLHADVPPTEDAVRENFGCRYGCGIFELRRRSVSGTLSLNDWTSLSEPGLPRSEKVSHALWTIRQ